MTSEAELAWCKREIPVWEACLVGFYCLLFLFATSMLASDIVLRSGAGGWFLLLVCAALVIWFFRFFMRVIHGATPTLCVINSDQPKITMTSSKGQVREVPLQGSKPVIFRDTFTMSAIAILPADMDVAMVKVLQCVKGHPQFRASKNLIATLEQIPGVAHRVDRRLIRFSWTRLALAGILAFLALGTLSLILEILS